MYEHKTYGIWNLMIQKKIDKDSRIYFGIDNLFNHRDDDRALSARVYRIGSVSYTHLDVYKRQILYRGYG